MNPDLDHVALATRDASHAVRALAGDLGGTIIFGGEGPGFRPMQIVLGDADRGMRIELLEPWRVDENDFLDRFLTRHGPGPHHLTFKIQSLDDALEQLRTAGLRPVGIDRSDPQWQEAFLLPAEAQGTVVQLAQAVDTFATRADLLDHVQRNGPDAHPKWWPDPPGHGQRRAYLDRVVFRTPSLDAALDLFAGLLQGVVEGEDAGSVDLVWPGGARLRLLADPEPTPGIAWLEGEIHGPGTELEVAGTTMVLASSGPRAAQLRPR